ncbi:DoxX family protein [Saccharolobus islandicus]|uniref:DoxX family protein n=5 Tax=Saccharolobus islandicus TaxID=43080 RepID=F0NC99_SACI5|nr:DoxX family protein [Sulfolobus islandicus]ACP39317.1 DoxX family protein [Sulfolobus islandicus M.14.25]ACP56499.1 DoxX family protein [Sulfolobus islandicus M.16.27]ACR43185.1 DoxX family protein [Sulfolobus islandicus M.16.4]ADX83887.1 DoxX family protein [Sulfolobus islandicus HVE10/4]ADX86538.1 DoxX family protein [Sulfolobus islandicus REY15A]
MDPTLASVGLLIFRILYGIALIPHGVGKANKNANSQFKGFIKQLGVPPIFVDLSMLVEILGGLLVMIGAISLIVSAVLILFFLGTIVVSHRMKKPLATGMNPGVDLDILFLAGAIILLLLGPGEFALLAGPQI